MWKAWEQLCFLRIHGGLGFRTTTKSNEAFIAKLTWLVASKRISLCLVSLKSKYKVKDDSLRANSCKYASNTWKAVERMKSLINKGACFLVGDRVLIDVWRDPWIPWLPNFIPSLRMSPFLLDLV